MKHTSTFKAIVNHYSKPQSAPLSVKEFFERFDTRKLSPAENSILNDLVVACNDNMVRVRISHSYVETFKS